MSNMPVLHSYYLSRHIARMVELLSLSSRFSNSAPELLALLTASENSLIGRAACDDASTSHHAYPCSLSGLSPRAWSSPVVECRSRRGKTPNEAATKHHVRMERFGFLHECPID